MIKLNKIEGYYANDLFKQHLKYYIKEKLIYYRKKLDSISLLIKIIMKFNNKLYKLGIKICYKNFLNRAESYNENMYYYSKKL